jgi:hypothetical protein
MESVPSNIKQIIDDLAINDKQLLSSELSELSNLNGPGIAFLDQVWAKIEVDRRRKIISRLLELAEENFELNFDGVFKSSLKDKDPEVRAKSIEGLWENEETALIGPYIRMLNEDSSELVQPLLLKPCKYAMLAELKK